MSSVKTTRNLLPKIRARLQKEWLQAQVQTIYRDEAQAGYARLMAQVRQIQPKHQWDDPIGELGGKFPKRDPRSSRQRDPNNKPIEEGWITANASDAKGFRLDSTSAHLNFQRFGFAARTIASGRKLLFWWGDPLPWGPEEPPQDSRAPGPFWFRSIHHPAVRPWGGSDFVERAVGVTYPHTVTALVTTLTAMFKNLVGEL